MNNHTDTLSQQYLIMLTFYYSDQLNFVTVINVGVFSVPLICSVIIIMQQIKGMLKIGKQIFPVYEFEIVLL